MVYSKERGERVETARVEDLHVESIWSDDGSQVTIRTNMGPNAAREIAMHETSGRGTIYWITFADERGMVDYTYWTM